MSCVYICVGLAQAVLPCCAAGELVYVCMYACMYACHVYIYVYVLHKLFCHACAAGELYVCMWVGVYVCMLSWLCVHVSCSATPVLPIS
jgi:hypothetical protein